MRWNVFQRKSKPEPEITLEMRKQWETQRTRNLAEHNERFCHSLVGRWIEPDIGTWSPGPVRIWEFYPDGTGQEFTESGMGTMGKQFLWRENDAFTLTMLDGDYFSDYPEKEDWSGGEEEAEPT